MDDLRVFFVVGSPRSGTTLLQSMLMQAEGVTMPPETHFYAITAQRADRLGPVTSDEGWAKSIAAIHARCSASEIEMDRAEFERICDAGPRSYATLLRAWLTAVAVHEGACVVGEKSPAHAEVVAELLEMMPDARFVHIVRDPRDVCLSQKEVWGRAILQSAVRWRKDLAQHFRYLETLPSDRYRAVKYEDLVADPAKTIEPLAEFLGIDYRPEMLDPSNRKKAGFASDETHKLQTLEKVTTNRIGRYKGKMKPMDVAVVERICGPLMQKMGYTLENKGQLVGTLGVAAQLVPAAMTRLKKSSARNTKLDRAVAAELGDE